MAITGTHTLLYSSEPERLRAVLRDVFALPGIDIGHGWMIFDLPPSEIAVHPADGPTFESGVRHQFSMMCDNIGKTITELKAKGIIVKNHPQEERWGVHVTLALPGGCDVMVYEPRHAVAAGMGAKRTAKKAAAKKSVRVRPKASAAVTRRTTIPRRARRAKPGRRRR
jgi:hypothetical protein